MRRNHAGLGLGGDGLVGRRLGRLAMLLSRLVVLEELRRWSTIGRCIATRLLSFVREELADTLGEPFDRLRSCERTELLNLRYLFYEMVPPPGGSPTYKFCPRMISTRTK